MEEEKINVPPIKSQGKKTKIYGLIILTPNLLIKTTVPEIKAVPKINNIPLFLFIIVI